MTDGALNLSCSTENLPYGCLGDASQLVMKS
jgi:hypothetical protein